MKEADWNKHFKKAENFIKDGIINKEQFGQNGQVKLLFLMWEPNFINHDKYEDKSFECIWNQEKNKLYSFARRIAEWTAYIFQPEWSYKEIHDECKKNPSQFLNKIAIVNLNKDAKKGKHNKIDFKKILANDAYIEALRDQIHEITPDFIIAGFQSKFEELSSLLAIPQMDWDENDYLMKYYIGPKYKYPVLSFFHPSQHNAPQPFHALFRACWNDLYLSSKH